MKKSHFLGQIPNFYRKFVLKASLSSLWKNICTASRIEDEKRLLWSQPPPAGIAVSGWRRQYTHLSKCPAIVWARQEAIYVAICLMVIFRAIANTLAFLHHSPCCPVERETSFLRSTPWAQQQSPQSGTLLYHFGPDPTRCRAEDWGACGVAA